MSLTYTLRQYKWIILFPSAVVGIIYADKNHTRKWKEQQNQTKSQLDVRRLANVKMANAVEEQV